MLGLAKSIVHSPHSTYGPFGPVWLKRAKKETTKTVSQLQSLKTTEMTLSTTSCSVRNGRARAVAVRSRKGSGRGSGRGSERGSGSGQLVILQLMADSFFWHICQRVRCPRPHANESSMSSISLDWRLDTFKCNFLVMRNYVILARTQTATTRERERSN